MNKEIKNKETEANASQIAAHIKNGDYNVAKDMFERHITNMKHWEALVFKDRIQYLAADAYDKAKADRLKSKEVEQ